MAKKKTQSIGHGKPITKKFEITYMAGHPTVDDEDSALEVLMLMEEAEEQIKPILDFIKQARTSVTDYARTSDAKVFQLEGHYWRRIQRFGRRWVATPADMPSPKPKGAKSLRELCEDKFVKKGSKVIPLWNFITKRMVDPALIDEAVSLGYLSQKEAAKAFIETPQAVYIQRFEGDALDAEDDE